MPWVKDKDARDLLNKLIDDYGWRWREGGKSAHSKGILLCPHEGRTGCKKAIFGTASGTLDVIKSTYNRCDHKPDDEESPF
ncbi:hypothetical protein [Demequina zhanjiangensis]|uniref:HicA toxin of toxin-antitoxin n=1 Tax=Demequina zhanjiangensis TaxID=3051659 RepID=A0ABT8G3K3_9MICO|nr:hypothetical protein [Demequina sp. SYSU T00b26]MDN4473721.1 hypothetical protein [Demequina sp. SYSU T00b26]